MSDTKTDVSNPEVLVREKLDELISFRKENDSKTDFWAKQFDLGLACVHFPEGAGGLNVNPKFQLLVNETLRHLMLSSVFSCSLMSVFVNCKSQRKIK